MYSVVQKGHKQTMELPVEPHDTMEANGQYSVVQDSDNTRGKDLDLRKEVGSIVYLTKCSQSDKFL